MRHIFLCCLTCAIGSVIGRSVTDVNGYYWRDFGEAVPQDALAGGTDLNGKPIYIGQVLYEKYLVPAKIYSNDNKSYFEYNGGEHIATQNIKILCTQYPEQFEWIATNNDDIKMIKDKDLIIGGYDKSKTTTYIGRIRSRGEITVGKIIVDIEPQWKGLHVAVNGKYEKYTSYEVLAYNEKLPKHDNTNSTTLIN